MIELRAMELPSLFDGLAEIGLRGSADMRPTLIRVLTDLYVQKLKHTADEERRYLRRGTPGIACAMVSSSSANLMCPYRTYIACRVKVMRERAPSKLIS